MKVYAHWDGDPQFTLIALVADRAAATSAGGTSAVRTAAELIAVTPFTQLNRASSPLPRLSPSCLPVPSAPHPHQRFASSFNAKVLTVRNIMDILSANLANHYIRIPISEAQVSTDAATFNLNTGDSNSIIPDERRCVVLYFSSSDGSSSDSSTESWSDGSDSSSHDSDGSDHSSDGSGSSDSSSDGFGTSSHGSSHDSSGDLHYSSSSNSAEEFNHFSHPPKYYHQHLSPQRSLTT
ncbi:unnamed protein product [Closterium sp. NIES-54]